MLLGGWLTEHVSVGDLVLVLGACIFAIVTYRGQAAKVLRAQNDDLQHRNEELEAQVGRSNERVGELVTRVNDLDGELKRRPDLSAVQVTEETIAKMLRQRTELFERWDRVLHEHDVLFDRWDEVAKREVKHFDALMSEVIEIKHLLGSKGVQRARPD